MSEPIKHRALGAWCIKQAGDNYNVVDAVGGIVATFFGPDAFYCTIAFLFAPKLVGIVRKADRERRKFVEAYYKRHPDHKREVE